MLADKNIVFEFETNKLESKNKNISNTQFESKSLDNMLEIGKITGKSDQKQPQLFKEKKLTIEEFYRQSPDVKLGRSSRLSRKYL